MAETTIEKSDIMEIVQITEENMESFLPLLGEDLTEDLKRVYFGGIGVIDDDENPLGAWIYELLNAESCADIEGRICFSQYEKEEIFDLLRQYFTENTIEEEGIGTSSYVLKEEASAKKFAESGFSMEKKEGEALRITLGEMTSLPIAAKKKLPDYVSSVENLTLQQFRNAVKAILFKGHKGVMEDIAYLPMNWFDTDVSACIISEDKVPGMFLVRRTPSGTLIPALLFAYGPEFKKNLLLMLNYSIHKALEMYPPETNALIIRKDAGTKALSGKLFPDRSGDEVYFGTNRENA